MMEPTLNALSLKAAFIKAHVVLNLIQYVITNTVCKAQVSVELLVALSLQGFQSRLSPGGSTCHLIRIM